MKRDASEFTALGHRVEGTLAELDRFPRPETVDRVVMTSDEVTAVCPVTGQPDFYRVEIDYVPSQWCIESKSLKLYLQSFREQGAFCEEFAAIILDKVRDAIEPVSCVVTLDQKARGGITIRATASYPRDGA